MIGNITGVSGAAPLNQLASARTEETEQAPERTAEEAESSSVVSLQSSQHDANAGVKANVIDSENAESFALDIAAMLQTDGIGVQANISGFEAAALLS